MIMTKPLSFSEQEILNTTSAIVLGGGRGTRLYPLTKVRSKPAVPLCGRYRLVDIPLSNCINSGINRISVLTQFNSHSLNRHINRAYKFDEFNGGFVEILAAEQTNETGDWFQGTADAVRKHLYHISQSRTSHFLILSGDQLYRMDYRTLLKTHIEKDADITVAALPVSREAAQGFGIMKVNRNAGIRRFVEKPSDDALLDSLITPSKVFDDFGLSADGKDYLASMGIYVFKAHVLADLLLSHPEWVDFGKELLPNSLKSHKVFAHMFYGFWEDIGTVRSYFDVSMAMVSSRPPFQFHDPNNVIYTHARMLPGVRIDRSTTINAILCSGTRIEQALIEDSIIGIRSIVRPGAVIKNSVVLGADYFEEAGSTLKNPIGIGRNTQISRAIIDHNARIGDNVVIRGSKRLKDTDGDGFAIRDGIVVVLKDAVIPKGAQIGDV
ncbi:MAG TPA: glucose-1-phosphate adenylyltransferase [Candidatus Hydrogenedentes bacterium]|jgi:glucose-1-phosphate adenylyltransferase|nr:glucose-1-phosphate adenylyltransferase [Candidatus Hydrogenedentota bacterium]HQB03809.1 glucose-1-phosphate adenylyltransferase [Candidatus Hydrogenedentota bacterium]